MGTTASPSVRSYKATLRARGRATSRTRALAARIAASPSGVEKSKSSSNPERFVNCAASVRSWRPTAPSRRSGIATWQHDNGPSDATGTRSSRLTQASRQADARSACSPHRSPHRGTPNCLSLSEDRCRAPPSRLSAALTQGWVASLRDQPVRLLDPPISLRRNEEAQASLSLSKSRSCMPEPT